MNKIFEAVLSINKPWYIKNIEFDPDKKQLDLYVDFKRGRGKGCCLPRRNTRYSWNP